MPNPSRNNVVTVFTPTEQIENSPKLDQQIKIAGDAKNWFYGTEELLDALPKAWTRSMLYVLVGFTTIIIPWSMLSKVDESGSARGRIEPKGATQKLDSQAGGKVTDVRVTEGENVKAGQILVKLESDVLQTELQQLHTKLEGLQNHRAQLDLLNNQLKLAIHVQEQQNQAQQLEKLAQVEQVRQNLDALKSAYNLQKEEKLAKVSQIRQTLESSKATFKLAQVRLSGAQEKVPRYRKAFADGAIPQDRLLDVEQSVKENDQNLVQAKSELSRSQSSLQEQQSSYQRTIHQAEVEIQQAQLRLLEQQRSQDGVIQAGKLAIFKSQEQIKNLQSQITDLQSEIAQTKSQIISIKLQIEQRVVRSPINGVIFDLPITKPGSVVQPGQRIAQIAPNNYTFVLKAKMPIQNSGFLKLGSKVKIKFDAYPFQDYGVIPGRVTWISPDSKAQETNQGKVESFELEIALNQHYIETGNNRIKLAAGQTATAEVIIRQRRVMDYLLDPFKKLQKGGLEL